MTNDERTVQFLMYLARSLALAGDSLSEDCPSPQDIDCAFVEVAICWFCMRYTLREKFHREVQLPEMLSSPRFQRLESELLQRIDESFTSPE